MSNLKDKLLNFNNNFSQKEFNNSETIQFPIITKTLPYGSFVEILGEPGKGKSTLALLIADRISKNNKVVAYIDGEYSLDSLYLSKLNLDSDIMFLFPTVDKIDIIDLICYSSKTVDLIILDSLACIDYDNICKNIKKLITTISHSNCSLIYTNQMRSSFKKRGVHSYGGYDLKRECVLRLEVEKTINIEKNKIFNINIIKNKLSSMLGTQKLIMETK